MLELGHLDFLHILCQDEISRRQSMCLTRRIRFETEATLEGFDFTRFLFGQEYAYRASDAAIEVVPGLLHDWIEVRA